MKKNETLKLSKKILFTFCATTALITVSHARPGGENGKPPKEAIEACNGEEAGTKCSVNTPRGTLTGQCMNTPDEKYFVCMPEGGPEKR